MGCENGTIRLLQFDQNAAEKLKETQSAGAKSSLQRDKNPGNQNRILTKLADYVNQGHTDKITQLKWIRLNPKPNSQVDVIGQFLSTSHDKTLKLWDTRNTGQPVKTLKLADRIVMMEVLPNGLTNKSANINQTVLVACVIRPRNELDAI